MTALHLLNGQTVADNALAFLSSKWEEKENTLILFHVHDQRGKFVEIVMNHARLVNITKDIWEAFIEKLTSQVFFGTQNFYHFVLLQIDTREKERESRGFAANCYPCLHAASPDPKHVDCEIVHKQSNPLDRNILCPFHPSRS